MSNSKTKTTKSSSKSKPRIARLSATLTFKDKLKPTKITFPIGAIAWSPMVDKGLAEKLEAGIMDACKTTFKQITDSIFVKQERNSKHVSKKQKK